jgi:hypothetical protein
MCARMGDEDPITLKEIQLLTCRHLEAQQLLEKSLPGWG